MFRKKKKQTTEELEQVRLKEFLDMAAPSVIRFNTDHYICGNTYRCVWALREYPTSTDDQAILRHLGEKNGVTLRIYTRVVTPLEERRIIHAATNKNRMKRANTQDIQQTIAAESNLQDVATLVATMHQNHEPPFTDSGIVGILKENGELGIGNIMEHPEDLKTWRGVCRQMIDQSETAMEVAGMITKSYAFGFLKYAEDHLSKRDLSQMLSAFWTMTEAPNQDPNLNKRELVRLFRKSDPAVLMDTEELEQLHGLADTVTIYRGVRSSRPGNVEALSWTLNKKTAEWFAHRFGRDGTVYEAQIDRDQILAVFNSRNEAEVIVDPKCLRGVTAVQTMQYTQEMNG